jgi:hypothetical protein
MIVTTIKRTTIKISTSEIKRLVQLHLEEKGYVVEQIQYNIKTEYDGSLGDPGTEVFTGMTIVANVEREDHEVN